MILTETRPAAAPVLSARPVWPWMAGVLLLLVAAYWNTAASIVAIWERSGTFTHGYTIVPISLWLIWQRRASLRGLPMQPFWPALALLALCGLGWLLADLGEVQVVRQFMFVLMLPLCVLALLGMRLAVAIAFPLLFLLFGVPFGDSFVDPLMSITADFTVDALRYTGIPVLREGNNFTIPSGSWSVVEACSGVRYLIASVTLGSLYAYLTYRSLSRRLVFVLLSILVPIVANGLRAYMIVMIGHLSDMTMAVGVDHLIYGWLFFGLVMFLLFWLGSFWREDVRPNGPAARWSDAVSGPRSPRLPLAALAIVFVAAVWPAYAWHLQAGTAGAPLPQLAAPALAAPEAAPFTAWAPSYAQARAELRKVYRQDGHDVGLTVLYYRNQDQSHKLISSTNRLIDTEGKEGWHVVSAVPRQMTVAGKVFTLRESVVSGPGGKLLVWSWNWIGGALTSNDYMGKVLQVRQKLLTGSDDGAAVIVYAPYDEKPEQARAVLQAFADASLPALETTLAASARK